MSDSFEKSFSKSLRLCRHGYQPRATVVTLLKRNGRKITIEQLSRRVRLWMGQW